MTSATESILTVSALNRLARGALETALPLCWVSGEISNLSYAASGHVYFSLKDTAAQVRCVMFRPRAQLLAFRLANGMHAQARALPTLYESRGDYQLTVEAIRHGGVGALFEAYERLRTRLAAEGLFDESRKRRIPPYPQRVAVISSPQAAALRDVLSTLARRAPSLAVHVFPVPVQGPEAAAAIVAALGAAATHCDVIIVARGGGSIEDLWAFNDEDLARAIAASPVPVVSGIGHETDATIADFVADLRAPTPTAAAELVSAGYMAATARLAQLAAQLARESRRTLERAGQRLDLVAAHLVHPGERLARSRLGAAHLGDRLRHAVSISLQVRRAALERFGLRMAGVRPALERQCRATEALQLRLRAAMSAALANDRHRVKLLAGVVAQLDPARVLARGYAIVRDEHRTIVHAAAALRNGDRVSIQFAVGEARARVVGDGE